MRLSATDTRVEGLSLPWPMPGNPGPQGMALPDRDPCTIKVRCQLWGQLVLRFGADWCVSVRKAMLTKPR